MIKLKEKIEYALDQNWISQKKLLSYNDKFHGLSLYNYTPEYSYSHKPNEWNEVVKRCRGLCLDENYNIVSVGFPKFFNYEEYEDKSFFTENNDDKEITEKIDGSLIFVSRHCDELLVHTKGSFNSWQAKNAKKFLNEKKVFFVEFLLNEMSEEDRVTFLFEYISPDNKIVVNYEKEDLVFLDVLNHDDHSRNEILYTMMMNGNIDSFTMSKFYGDFSLDNLRDECKNEDQKVKEGFVVFYKKKNFRVKLKYENYVKIHRIKSSITTKNLMKLFIDEVLYEIEDVYEWSTKNYNLIRDKKKEVIIKYFGDILEDDENMKNFIQNTFERFHETCHWINGTFFIVRKILSNNENEKKERKFKANFLKEKYSEFLSLYFSYIDDKNILKPYVKLFETIEKRKTEERENNDDI